MVVTKKVTIKDQKSNATDYNIIFDRSSLDTRWANVQSIKDLHEKLKTFAEDGLGKNPSDHLNTDTIIDLFNDDDNPSNDTIIDFSQAIEQKNNFFVLQSQLSSNGKTIIKSQFKYSKYNSLMDMAKDVKEALPRLLEELHAKHKRTNIVLTDFTDKDTADIILNMNKNCP